MVTSITSVLYFYKRARRKLRHCSKLTAILINSLNTFTVLRFHLLSKLRRMADTEAAPLTETAAVATKPKTPKKKPSKTKTMKKPSNHPKYSDMIKEAIGVLKDRGGSSRQALLRYIMKHYKVGDEKSTNAHLKLALRAGVKNGGLKQSKGTGASGSFKVGEGKKTTKAKKVKKVMKPKSAAKRKINKKPKKTKSKKSDSDKKSKKNKVKKVKKSADKKSKTAKPKKLKKINKTKKPKPAKK